MTHAVRWIERVYWLEWRHEAVNRRPSLVQYAEGPLQCRTSVGQPGRCSPEWHNICRPGLPCLPYSLYADIGAYRQRASSVSDRQLMHPFVVYSTATAETRRPSPYDLYCVGGTLSLTQSVSLATLHCNMHLLAYRLSV